MIRYMLQATPYDVYLYPTTDLILVIILILLIIIYLVRGGILYPIIGIFILVYARLYAPFLATTGEYSGLLWMGFFLIYLVMTIYGLKSRRGG